MVTRAIRSAEHWQIATQTAARLIRAYGTDAALIPDRATTPDAVGQDFGATLTEAKAVRLMTYEYATYAADVVWRRSKLGFRMSHDDIATLDRWMQSNP